MKQPETPIVLIGCLHLGSKSHDAKLAEGYRNYILKNRKAKVILLGDLMECSIPGHKPETMWGQDRTPQEQYNDALEYIRPFKARVVGACTSNHSARIRKATSIDLDAQLAQALGYEDVYKGVGGVTKVKVGRQEYKVAIAHGRASGMDPWRDAKQLLSVYPYVDMVALSHKHRMVWEWFGHLDNDNNLKKVAFVRTGATLTYARYAQEAMYTPNIPGFSIVWLGEKERSIRPDTSGYLP